ncbi:MAG: alpha/beta hydrolase family protein [Alphaproteobacteria bacterium]
MRRRAPTFLCLLLASTAAEAASDVRVPMVTRAGDHLTLEGRLYDHDGAGRRPAIVLTHGSPRGAERRRDPDYGRFEAQAEWFRDQGFVVLSVKRRGYGTSDGRFVETSGSCEARDHAFDGFTSANDIKAAVAYVRGLPSVDPSRVVLVGQSAGGWGALAHASRRPEGVVAVVNFAGGRGAVADGTNCNPDGLVDAAARYGRTTAVPSLWLYAANDRYFPPDLSRRMHQAYAGATTAEVRYVGLPALGEDGHQTFPSAAGAGHWQPVVKDFLSTLAR